MRQVQEYFLTCDYFVILKSAENEVMEYMILIWLYLMLKPTFINYVAKSEIHKKIEALLLSETSKIRSLFENQ